jgi:phosphate-selective porin
MTYWEQRPGAEETRTQFLYRLERNLSTVFTDIDSHVYEHRQELEKVALLLASIDSSLQKVATHFSDLLYKLEQMTSSDHGNILERAYMLAVMQERQEMKQQLEELQLLAATLREASNEEEVRQASEGTKQAEPS